MKAIIKTENGNYTGNIEITGNKATVTDLLRLTPGRPPTAKEKVDRWRMENPTGTPVECIKNTGIPKATVYKYWKGE